MEIYTDYFYGHEVSDYGKKHGYVDYRTLAKAFDAVLNNDIMYKTNDIGYWELVSGYKDNSEEIEELEKKSDELVELITEETTAEEDEKITAQIEEINKRIEELEEEQEPEEVFQWYIVDDNGARILEEAEEILYYNEELDMYIWGVTHWGTSWDYVLTNIKIIKETAENE